VWRGQLVSERPDLGDPIEIYGLKHVQPRRANGQARIWRPGQGHEDPYVADPLNLTVRYREVHYTYAIYRTVEGGIKAGVSKEEALQDVGDGTGPIWGIVRDGPEGRNTSVALNMTIAEVMLHVMSLPIFHDRRRREALDEDDNGSQPGLH
jgi:hypothetical protein